MACGVPSESIQPCAACSMASTPLTLRKLRCMPAKDAREESSPVALERTATLAASSPNRSRPCRISESGAPAGSTPPRHTKAVTRQPRQVVALAARDRGAGLVRLLPVQESTHWDNAPSKCNFQAVSNQAGHLERPMIAHSGSVKGWAGEGA